MDHALWARRLAGGQAVAAAIALCTMGLPAGAQETFGQGVLNAQAFDAIPAGAVAVQVLDDSDDNLVIRDRVIAELGARGVTVADAPVAAVMVIATREDPGAYTTPSQQEPTRLRDQGGRLSVMGEMNIPRIISAPLPSSRVTTRSSYELRLMIEAPQGGGALWEGWATAPLSEGNPVALAERMIPHLIDRMGQTVRAEPFDLN